MASQRLRDCEVLWVPAKPFLLQCLHTDQHGSALQERAVTSVLHLTARLLHKQEAAESTTKSPLNHH